MGLTGSLLMSSSTSKSQEIFEKLCEVIPGGVNSPVRACKAVADLPLIASHGKGSSVFDVDGREFVDFCMSWGALIHGHANPEIAEAVTEQLKKGSTYGITSEVEEKLARKVTKLIPSIERIRFVSSGTEAAMSAIRLARGYTGRDFILKFQGHYHGHADFLLIQAGSGVLDLNPAASSKGVPEEFVKYTLSLPFNDLKATKELLQSRQWRDKIACVILEPIAGNIGVVPAQREFIQMLREETKKAGIVLIFDEVITGFRVAKGGASEIYNIQPDLTCLGKIVGGGLPAAAFGGKKGIMECLAPLGPVYQAGTLSGNPLAMVAGLKALELLEKPFFYENLQKKTDFFLSPLEELIKKRNLPASIQRVGSMFTLFWGRRSIENSAEAKACDFEKFAQFFRYLLSNGVYIPPLQQEASFISTAHSEEELERSRILIENFLLS